MKQTRLNINRLKSALGYYSEKQNSKRLEKHLTAKGYWWKRINVVAVRRHKNPNILRGMSDYIAVKRRETMFNTHNKMYFIEVKAEKGSIHSDAQKEFQAVCELCPGVRYVLWKGDMKVLERAGL